MDKTNLIAALGLTTVVAAATLASCQEDDPNKALTTNASLMATGGNGGTAGTANDGGGGSGANGGSTDGGGGSGGEGGGGEQAIHGCLSTTAVDQTGNAGSTINMNIPGGNYCLKVTVNTDVTFTLTDGSNPNALHRPLGGTYVEATQEKFPDASSPIVSCCDASPYVCCPMVSTFDMSTVGVYPWYDDNHPATIKGVVYVVP